MRMNPMIPESVIANKHGVSIGDVHNEMLKGIEVEREHTDDRDTAATIASHHIYDILDYYDRLEAMESEAEEDKQEGEEKE